MSENNSSPPSFSVLLAELQAKLQHTLATVQALPQDKAKLDIDVENMIKSLVHDIKVLKFLLKGKWEQADNKANYSLPLVDYDGKLVVSKELINRNLVGDMLALHPYGQRINRYVKDPEMDCISVELQNYGVIWLKAKHLPFPPQQTEKLIKVELADGNTAWLTWETLKTVKQLIANK